tara:strand:+ start:131 stop:481 length:351 start_codon:yes stop_codon:yes gene_type:complete
MSLKLKYKNKSIGIVRNPYERVVTEYYYSFNYIGFDKWAKEFPLTPQTELYKNCDYIVNFDNWKQELKEFNLHPKDTSILDDVKIVTDWNRWYTMRSKTHIAGLYKDDIMTYGYSF